MTNENNMLRENTNRKQTVFTPQEYIKGKFTLQNLTHRVSKNNKPYIYFDIQTDLLPIRAIAWSNSCFGNLNNLHHGQHIELEGTWKTFNGIRQVHCNKIVIIENHDQYIETAKVLIREIFDSLTDMNLKNFVSRVMNDQSIIDDYITAPASLNHHHAYQGGLFVHSVDVAYQLSHQRQINDRERQIAVVAGLFHDLGKIKTMTAKMTRTELGKLVRHEDLTLEILASHLQWLEQTNPQLSTYLRYVLAWNKKTYSAIPALDICDAIHAFDRLSASGLCNTNNLIRDYG